MIGNAFMSSPDGMIAERGKGFAPMIARIMKTPLITHIVLLCMHHGNEQKAVIAMKFGHIRHILHAIFVLRGRKESPACRRGIANRYL